MAHLHLHTYTVTIGCDSITMSQQHSDYRVWQYYYVPNYTVTIGCDSITMFPTTQWLQGVSVLLCSQLHSDYRV